MEKYPVDNELVKEIERRFVYHAPKGEQPEKYETIRSNAKLMAINLLGLCPSSRELSVALTKLDEVVFWANAAIAREEL